jgi:hypothetical protein
MLNKIVFSAILISSSAAFAANTNNTVVISDSENVATFTVADKYWAVVATNQVNGMTKMREFYDMGTLGLQQIDYVVNCADQKLAMAGFAVIPTMSAKSDSPNNRSYADLSFYTPVIHHDKNIVDNVCSGRFAVRSAQVAN